ncbi:MAG: VUT family protein, partial [Erythrobacter sp.]
MEKPLPGAASDPGAAFDTDPDDGIRATSLAPVTFRYYDFVMAAFVAILLLSNLIGAAKLTFVDVPFWPDGWWPAPDGVFIYGAGILFFPLGYVIGDVLTEIYGFARARRVIWTGFAAMVFLAFMSWVVVGLPAFDGWACAASDSLSLKGEPDAAAGAICQQTYVSVFGSTWRIVIASITA